MHLSLRHKVKNGAMRCARSPTILKTEAGGLFKSKSSSQAWVTNQEHISHSDNKKGELSGVRTAQKEIRRSCEGIQTEPHVGGGFAGCLIFAS